MDAIWHHSSMNTTKVDWSDNPASAPGSAGAVLGFLDYTVEKGYMKAATANSMKVAVREVLSATEGEGWDVLRIQEIDVQDLTRRFCTLRAMKYKQESLETYGKRFANAIGMYEEFLKDPSGWRPT